MKQAHSKRDLVEYAKALGWPIVVAIALLLLYPQVREFIDAMDIAKFSLAGAQVELDRIPGEHTTNQLVAAKAGIPFISDADKKLLSSRFEKNIAYTRGANILWVDNNDPYANVLERRVLTAAGINVDQATSTVATFSWLQTGLYDLLITNLRSVESARECSAGTSSPTCARWLQDNPIKPCYDGPDAKANSGCFLIRTLQDCYNNRRPADPLPVPCYTHIDKLGNQGNILIVAQKRLPQMIVYAEHLPSAVPKGVWITNDAARLFNLILDGLDEREVRS